MIRFYLAVIIFCSFALTALAQQDSTQNKASHTDNIIRFVKEGTAPLPDAYNFLPAPPSENDTRFISDSCLYEVGKTLRGTLRGDTAVADAGYAIEYFLERFSAAMNRKLTPEKNPKLTELIKGAMLAGNESVQNAKMKHARRRPFHHFGEHTPIPQEEFPGDFTSYPSGHTVRAWIAALTLTTVCPEYADGIMKVGYEIGQSRTIVGFHYQSDVDAARFAASATFARLCAEKSFLKAIEKARKELNK